MRERIHHARRAALGLLVIAASTGATTGAPTPPGLELPVRDVTVFSDRARVTRRAEVKLESGERRVRLPYLPATLEPGSVRLEATGAKVVRLEVVAAERAEFPRGEAFELLKVLERLKEEAQALRDEAEPLRRERAMLLGLRPEATPMPDPKGGPVLLDPSGWKTSLAFLEARETSIAAALAPIEAKSAANQREIVAVAARAEQLAAETNSRPGHRVEAIVAGQGRAATLALTYVARGARWYPTYDVRSEPGESKVDLDLGALVAQETGEDWTDATLVLSTAVPAATPTLPKLAVWKISDQERFIPTPRAGPKPRGPRPTPPRPEPPQPLAASEVTSDEGLRERLMVAAAEAGEVLVEASEMLQEGGPRARKMLGPAEAPSPSMSAPPMPAPQVRAQRKSAAALSEPELASDSLSVSAGSMVSDSRPTQALPFGAPPGWTMPSFAADLPAALAGGYAFTYTAVRPETVRSGEGPRRVALGSRALPAAPRLEIFPALSKDAYLVAELTNATDRPLLKGRANLFVGADLQGTAELPTTAVGAKVPVSLGIDDAIAIERNVRTIEGERGLFSKQDVATYEVVIELLNPRSRPVVARIRDQVPLSDHKDKVEIAFEKADFGAVPDAANGLLEWTLELSPGVKRTLTYRYVLARPLGWRPTERAAPLRGNR